MAADREPGNPLVLHAKTHDGPEPRGGSGVQRYQVEENDKTYVVKLKGTRQGIRVLFNEYVSGRLGELLEIPLGETALVDVPVSLQPANDRRVPTQIGGTHFGTARFPDAQTDTQKLPQVANFPEFCGVVVFDTFIARGNSRQNILYPSDGKTGSPRDRAAIFDQGFAFTGDPNWTVETLRNAQDCQPKDDLEIKRRFGTLDAYEPYLRRLEELRREDIRLVVHEAPLEEWQVTEEEAGFLVNWLDQRKMLVRAALEDYLT